jgi:cell volume regulation protein A
MPIEPLSILSLLGTTIVLGYIGLLIFEKTKIPDAVWLLLFGLIVGPLLGLVDRSIFIAASPLLGAIALLIILFDAGLNMDFYNIIREIPRSLLLTILGVLFSVMAVSLISILVFKMDFMSALLLGVIVSGTSSAAVVSLISPLKINEGVKMILGLESIFTDPIVIVVGVTLLEAAVSTIPLTNLVNILFSAYSIAIVVGSIVGIVWLMTLDRIRRREFDYILTLAITFLLYVATEMIGGSGSIAILVCGIVLGNGVVFSKFLKFRKKYKIKIIFKRFQKEIAFFMRSFFFVYLGLIATISFTSLFYGILITAVIILMRFLSVQIGTYNMKVTDTEMNVMRIMVPRGLAAAILAQMLLSYDIPGAEEILNITFVVILLTTVFTTIAIKALYKPSDRKV